MNTILERTSTLFNRRFLLNAFLPTLVVLSGTVGLCLFQAGVLDDLTKVWSQLSGSEQLVILAGWLAAIWFFASFLASQFRAVTQIFEGYPLTRRQWLRPVTKYLLEHHRRRYGRLSEAENPLALRNYPILVKNFMPTRLGNILRSAEFYPYDRYGMDLPFAWPRLAQVLPTQYREEVHEFRATFEWLLAIAALMSASGTTAGLVLFVLWAPWWLFLTVFCGGWAIAFIAYRSALSAASEWAEQLRAGVDLYRTELLIALRLGIPKDNDQERRFWKSAVAFHRDDWLDPYPYAPYRQLPQGADSTGDLGADGNATGS